MDRRRPDRRDGQASAPDRAARGADPQGNAAVPAAGQARRNSLTPRRRPRVLAITSPPCEAGHAALVSCLDAEGGALLRFVRGAFGGGGGRRRGVARYA